MSLHPHLEAWPAIIEHIRLTIIIVEVTWVWYMWFWCTMQCSSQDFFIERGKKTGGGGGGILLWSTVLVRVFCFFKTKE